MDTPYDIYSLPFGEEILLFNEYSNPSWWQCKNSM